MKKVVGELAAEFQKMEDWHSRLERQAARTCDLLLGPPPARAQLTNCLDEVTMHLRVELAAWWEADVEMEKLQTSTTRVRD
jgi:hypothetical protein